MEEIYVNIGIILSSIVGWVMSKKWIFPMIIKCWEWITGKKKEIIGENIDTTKELNNLKREAAELYENRIDFLLSQISQLQAQVSKNSDELAELQNKISELQSQLYSKNITIHQLREHSCCISDCKYRVLCELEELKKEE